MKKDVLFLNAHLIKLALDDLIDQKNFFGKILLRERFLSYQKEVSANNQKGTEKEREEITHPPSRPSSLVWFFSH